MSGRHRGSIWTPTIAFMAGLTVAGTIGAILITVAIPPEKPPVVRTETVTETEYVPEVLSDAEIQSRYIQIQAAALPGTTFDDIRVATPLAVNVCENIRSGADVLDQPGVLETGTYQFAVQDAWDFTELAIRTYCPEYVEELQ